MTKWQWESYHRPLFHWNLRSQNVSRDHSRNRAAVSLRPGGQRAWRTVGKREWKLVVGNCCIAAVVVTIGRGSLVLKNLTMAGGYCLDWRIKKTRMNEWMNEWRTRTSTSNIVLKFIGTIWYLKTNIVLNDLGCIDPKSTRKNYYVIIR